MTKSRFFTRYNPPVSPITVLDYETKLVDQSEVDMCGLHYQLQRYGVDGLVSRFEAMKDKFGYADTRMIPSFAELQNKIVKGVNYFNNLPAEIRKEFNNDSGAFFTYLESNPKEAIEKGYIEGLDLKKYVTDVADVTVPQVQENTVETVVTNEQSKEGD